MTSSFFTRHAIIEKLLFPAFLVLIAVFTVNGAFRQAKDGEFPFHVSIQTGNMVHVCGGVIITPKWVLTSSTCLRGEEEVNIVYGTSDVSRTFKSVPSEKIEHEPEKMKSLKSRLAIIKVQTPIEKSSTSSPATLPQCSTPLENNTMFSGWRDEHGVPITLYVVDNYFILSNICTIPNLGEANVRLEPDEFCGMDDDQQNKLFNPGAVVSKNSVILGMLAFTPGFRMPHIFLMLAKHEEWIKTALGPDAADINWVDKIPTLDTTMNVSDSLKISLTLLVIVSFLTLLLSVEF